MPISLSFIHASTVGLTPCATAAPSLAQASPATGIASPPPLAAQPK
jgi:hypothetical protein